MQSVLPPSSHTFFHSRLDLFMPKSIRQSIQSPRPPPPLKSIKNILKHEIYPLIKRRTMTQVTNFQFTHFLYWVWNDGQNLGKWRVGPLCLCVGSIKFSWSREPLVFYELLMPMRCLDRCLTPAWLAFRPFLDYKTIAKESSKAQCGPQLEW